MKPTNAEANTIPASSNALVVISSKTIIIAFRLVRKHYTSNNHKFFEWKTPRKKCSSKKFDIKTLPV
jgi:hypothetical protein